MAQTILITGAGSGFGLLTAKSLAKAGHIVYGGIHHKGQSRTPDANDPNPVHEVLLDITSTESVQAAVQRVVSESPNGFIDTVIHNAGHMGIGPAESFSEEQFHEYYEINAVGAHRLNRAILPIMRKTGKGHVIWVSSSSARGGSGPLLAPYFAAKAAMHSMAISLSTEIAGWGIETTLVVPGIFTTGTDHFANAGKPEYPDIAAGYMEGPLKGADLTMMANVNEQFPKDATPQLVADAILRVVDAPRGSKPFRVMVDPFQDGSEEIMDLADKSHEDFLKRCGIFELCTYRAE